MQFQLQLGQLGRGKFGANGPRYWRINYLSAQNSTEFLHACDVEMRTAPGGANVAYPGRTYSMHATAWAGSADEPWDGNTNSNLMSVFGTTAGWIGVDFGLDGGLEIVQLHLTPSSTESNVWQYNPKALDVQYSHDNSTWTTSWSVADAGFWLTMAPQTLTKP